LTCVSEKRSFLQDDVYTKFRTPSDKADAAMYEGKKNGRNQCHLGR